ncbi:MAG: hypothetical protein ACHP8B_10840 [Terriglobales bacterium]
MAKTFYLTCDCGFRHESGSLSLLLDARDLHIANRPGHVTWVSSFDPDNPPNDAEKAVVAAGVATFPLNPMVRQ